MEGHYNVALGIVDNQIKMTPFADAISAEKVLNEDLLEMSQILSL